MSQPKNPIQIRKGWAVWLFTRYARRYLSRHFHGIRLSRTGAAPERTDGPLIVVLNHPSWWDPLMGMLLSLFWPDRKHFVPIEETALQQYRFFERLGFFGINPQTLSGAREFLHVSQTLLAEAGTALWITAQGKFTDVRERPVRLQRGIGHLLPHLDRGTVVPLALEYPFWDERAPEALARFGQPVYLDQEPERTVDAWMSLLEEKLTEAQNALAEEAASRDPSRFEDLIVGRTGVGGVFDGWRRLKSWLSGKRFDSGHTQQQAHRAP